jgi:hypothetical protein
MMEINKNYEALIAIEVDKTKQIQDANHLYNQTIVEMICQFPDII